MSAADLREHLEAKWALIESVKMTEEATYAPVILTGWNYNLWRYPIEISRDLLIRVDGELMVHKARLERAAVRELPAFRKKYKVNKYRDLKIEPYTNGRYQYLRVKYSEARNNGYEDRLPDTRSYRAASALQNLW